MQHAAARAVGRHGLNHPLARALLAAAALAAAAALNAGHPVRDIHAPEPQKDT